MRKTIKKMGVDSLKMLWLCLLLLSLVIEAVYLMKERHFEKVSAYNNPVEVIHTDNSSN